MTRAAGSAVRCLDLVKIHGRGDAAVRALDGVSLEMARGRFTAIMGPSGSGKSTLLHCLAGLDAPTSGQVWISETEISQLGDAALTRLRRDRVGFIFQAFNLVPTLTAAENITLPLDIAGRRVDQAWYQQVVEVMGLATRLSHRPSELSGGQQQRVAAARALVSRPDIVFADEPSGNLDTKSSAELLDFLSRAVAEFGQTVVLVTHDASAAAHAHRVVFLGDGQVIEDVPQPGVERILDLMKGLGG